jgi:Carbohydrate binding module (family 6)
MKKTSVVFCFLLLVALLVGLENRASAVGATMPFTTYEGEAGTLAGGATVVAQVGPPSTTNYDNVTLEASGHAFASLTGTGQSVAWTNNTSGSFQAITVRFCIPDAPTGGGITATLDLYVNGTLRQTLTMSSAQTWLYNFTSDNNPADGPPSNFWDELPVVITGAAIAPGSTIMLKRDSTNTAAFYYIDCVDLEPLPAPIAQPANSLSIVSYGAVANNPSVDSTAAIQNCMNAAATAGKIAWVPAGTFYLNLPQPSLVATSAVTVEGAGIWYSTIFRNIPLPDTYNGPSGSSFTGISGCVVSNITFDGNSLSAAGPDAGVGGLNFSGSNWLVNSVWIRHMGSGVWASGTNGTIENSRLYNCWTDAINLNQVGSGAGNNLTATNNFIRASGDDSIAVNSVGNNGTTTYPVMQNPTVTNNTTIASIYGTQLAIYGGQNAIATNNLLCDGVRSYGLNVGVFGSNGSPVVSATVTGNTVLRCGGAGYGFDHPAASIGSPLDDATTSNVYFGNNTISNSNFVGLDLLANAGNVVLQNNVITSPGLTGILVDPTAYGMCAFSSNTVSGVAAGQVAFNNASSGDLQVYAPIQAASYDSENSIQTESCSEGGLDVGYISNGSYLVYNNMNVNGVTNFVARVASNGTGGNIQVRLDSATGTLIGTCAVPANTGGWQTWADVNCALTGASGFHNVYLVFTGGFNVQYFYLSGENSYTLASNYSSASSGIGSQGSSDGLTNIDFVTNGSYTSYNGINMNGVTLFQARVASNGVGGSIQVCLDSTTGTVIGTCVVPASTGGWQSWVTEQCNITPTSGTHNIYLVYSGGSSNLFNLEWFTFPAGEVGFNQTAAASYNTASSGIGTQGSSQGGLNLDFITNGSYTVYNNVNLTSLNSFTASVASNGVGGNIQVRLDGVTGTVIGTCTVPASTGGWQNWVNVTCSLTPTTGFHNLYLVYTGGSSNLFNLDWFDFNN